MSNTTSRASRTRSAPAAFRKRWRSAWLTACSCLAVAACGGGADETARPAIPAATAEALAARSDAVAESLAAGDPCAADRAADALVTAAVEAVNAGEVPAPLQEELLGSAQSLAARVECPPPPPPAEPGADEHEDEAKDKDQAKDKDEGKEEEKGKGKGKGRDKDEKGDDD